MTYQVPEEIPLTNDDEAGRKAAAFPTLRTTGPDEYIKFVVQTENAVVLEKGFMKGSYAIQLGVAPLDGEDNPSRPTARLELAIPIVNPDVEGHQAPDSGKDCERYFCARDPKTFPPLPTWNKMAKRWEAADGTVVERTAYDAMKSALYAKIVKTMRETWNAIRKGNNTNFVNDVFYAQVKASGDQKQYRNLRNVCSEPPTTATVVTEGFKTSAE